MGFIGKVSQFIGQLFENIDIYLTNTKKTPTPQCERQIFIQAMRGRSSFSPREYVRILPLGPELLVRACDLRQLLK